jgi:hypothetical protein
MRGKRTDATAIDAILADFRSSGLSAHSFCTQRGLSYTTFCGWRKRSQAQGVADSNQSPAVITFAPTAVTGSSPEEYRIEFACGTVQRIPVRGVRVEALIAALRGAV